MIGTGGNSFILQPRMANFGIVRCFDGKGFEKQIIQRKDAGSPVEVPQSPCFTFRPAVLLHAAQCFAQYGYVKSRKCVVLTEK